MTKITHDQLKKAALKREGVKSAYNALDHEFSLLEEMIKARLKAGKTQDEVAKAMKTTTSSVGRLETGGGKHQHSPTVETLRKYARALDCDLQIKFIKHPKYSKNNPKRTPA
jgi:transcriptional regulator with XRE-family HTH domain